MLDLIPAAINCDVIDSLAMATTQPLLLKLGVTKERAKELLQEGSDVVQEREELTKRKKRLEKANGLLNSFGTVA